MKRNCWQFMKCGREPGGANAADLGVCPVAIETKCDRVNEGDMGGRVCWIVGGTLCGGVIQGSFAQKVHNCLQCEFFRTVQEEQGEAFEHGASILTALCDPSQMVRAYEQLSNACHELIETRTQLEIQERLAVVGETIAGLAHCLKNTLNGLRAGQYVIDRAFETQDMEKLHSGWRVMKSSVRQVERLTFDMLYYITERTPARKLCDCSEIMNEIVLLLSLGAESLGIEIRAEPGHEVGKYAIDRNAIYRALLNLAVNAIDACAESETGNRVVLRSRGVEDGIVLTVEDNGIGMSEAVISQLFTRFFTTKTTKGTGLGLLVVKKIVEEHGGSVQVNSAQGRGSTIELHLPNNAESIDSLSPMVAMRSRQWEEILNGENHPLPKQGGRKMNASKWILIVDDQEEDVIFLSQILEDQNLEYKVARNGAEALTIVRESPPDLMLLDVMMPRKGGLAVVKAMKEDQALKSVPIILITGASYVTGVDLKTGEQKPKLSDGDDFLRSFGNTLHEQLKALGVHTDHIFEKPIVPPKLIDKIEQILA